MECHSINEEIVMESTIESKKNLLDSEVLACQHECESLCCTSDKPLQPLDKSILIKLKLAKKEHKFHG